MSVRLLLSCGEASGDLYAGALVHELRALAPDVEVRGLGGPRLAAAGGRLLEDYRGLAVTGLTEAVGKLPRSFAALNHLVESARANPPDALVVIDFPDFNLPLARRIKRLGVPVIYYISPQIWAWRASRLDAIRAVTDRMLVIFPFEEAIYRKGDVPVEFVGHPLIDLIRPPASREAFLTEQGLSPSAPTVALLPGSRPNEVDRILEDLLAAASRIRSRVPNAQFIIARAPHLDDSSFESVTKLGTIPIAVVQDDADAVLAASDLALTASGTATVQAALHDTPMVIVYRVSPLTYWLGRRLVRVTMIGMVNLIAGEKVAPELVQDAFTPDAVAAEAVDILMNADRAARIRAALADVRAKLGSGGASRRAAQAVLRIARHDRASH